jgi:hypothetical protein
MPLKPWFLCILSFFYVQGQALSEEACPESSRYKANQEAMEALQSDETITIEKLQARVARCDFTYYKFTSVGSEGKKALIFVPGADVQPESYALPLRSMALNGFDIYLIALENMIPGRTSPRIDKMLELHNAYETWVVGGHSAGGLEAIAYGRKNHQKIAGLVLWASYPSRFFRIDNLSLATLSIYGSKDGLTSEQTIEDNKDFLPADTVYINIKGGNHSQFGHYNGDTPQARDNPAAITREEQQDQIVSGTVSFVSEL